MVCLTAAPASRCEKLGQCLWPTEKLGVDEVARRLLLEHLLWAESERNLVESVRGFPQSDAEPWRKGPMGRRKA